MKRNILLLGVVASLAIVQTSCSSDDNNDNNNNNTPQQTVQLFTTSNTSGNISVTNLSGDGDVKNFDNGFTDADGIYYNAEGDYLLVASRTQSRLNLYEGVQGSIANNATTLNFTGNTSNADFTNPREISVSGNNIFVVQDDNGSNGGNKIFVYTKNGTEFTRKKVFTIDFNLWGIHAEGDDLYAVVDNSGELAMFDNIMSNPEGAIFPTKKITIEGLTRGHGITYSAEDDIMILTDIGASLADADGGIIVIADFTNVFNNVISGGTLSLALQNRVYGVNTTLGNPVDVAYDDVTNKIYIAENINAGGRVLTFNLPPSTNQNVAPVAARNEPGVSSVYLSRR